MQFFGAETGTVHSQGNLEVSISKNLNDMATWRPDVVVAVGGMIWESADAPDLRDLLNKLHGQGVTIAGI